MSYRIPPGWSGNSYMDACDRERRREEDTCGECGESREDCRCEPEPQGPGLEEFRPEIRALALRITG